METGKEANGTSPMRFSTVARKGTSVRDVSTGIEEIQEDEASGYCHIVGQKMLKETVYSRQRKQCAISIAWREEKKKGFASNAIRE